jgi:hypothetical protein
LLVGLASVILASVAAPPAGAADDIYVPQWGQKVGYDPNPIAVYAYACTVVVGGRFIVEIHLRSDALAKDGSGWGFNGTQLNMNTYDYYGTAIASLPVYFKTGANVSNPYWTLDGGPSNHVGQFVTIKYHDAAGDWWTLTGDATTARHPAPDSYPLVSSLGACP